MARLSILPKKAYFFDGSNDNITVPIFPSVSGFSLALWVNSTEITLNDRILDWQDAGPAKGFSLDQQVNGNINFQCNNGGSQTANISCGNWPIGFWHHLCVTHNGTTATTYQDGVQVSQDTSAVFNAAAATLTLGKRSGGSNLFKGGIADFVFINGRDITSTEISNIYNKMIVPSDTTVFYDFDNNVIDNSGNGNNGTATEGIYEILELSRTSISSGSNKALNFSRLTTPVLTVPHTSNLSLFGAQTFTWTFKLYISNLSENSLPRVCNKGGHYVCWMGDQTNAQRNRLALAIGDSSVGAEVENWGESRLQPFVWYDIATTWNGATGLAEIYINGEKETINVLSGPYEAPMTDDTNSNLLIGNSTGNDRNTGGKIKNFKQYNVILTTDEIRQITKGGNIIRGLVGKWDMTEGTGATVADTSGNSQTGTITTANWESLTLTRSSATRSASAARSAA